MKSPNAPSTVKMMVYALLEHQASLIMQLKIIVRPSKDLGSTCLAGVFRALAGVYVRPQSNGVAITKTTSV